MTQVRPIKLKWFKPEEFSCKCGCGLGFDEMYTPLLLALDAARDFAGVAFRITSAMRCPAHNKAVGGVPDSAHLKGKAVDIATQNSVERYLILRALLKVGITRLGIADGFIHCDVDNEKPQNVIWRYS